jgi:hypothetical protein
MIADAVRWIEVWLDSAAKGDYLLLLRQMASGRLELIDPQRDRELVRVFQSYDEACTWLNEDEYDLVEGRWTIES